MRRNNGEGTVTRRHNSTYAAALRVDGKRRWVYGPTEKDVRRKLALLQAQAAKSGTLPTPGRRTVADLIDAWLDAAAPTLKPRTLADYRAMADAYIVPAIGRLRLTRLTPDVVQRLVTPWQKDGKHRTAVKVHAVLHRACKVAVLWGWLADNPCDRILRPSYRPERKEMWSADELARFLAGARGHDLYPLYLLLVAAGLRLGEALALRWSDVDLAAGLVTVRRSVQRVGGEYVFTASKTRSGERSIGVPGDVAAELKRHRVRQIERLGAAGWTADGLVFTNRTGGVLCQSVAQHGLKRLCDGLRLPALTVHGLRHLHASLLLAEGLPITDVSRRLGHANPGITLTVYSHAIRRCDDPAAAIVEHVLKRR